MSAVYKSPAKQFRYNKKLLPNGFTTWSYSHEAYNVIERITEMAGVKSIQKAITGRAWRKIDAEVFYESSKRMDDGVYFMELSGSGRPSAMAGHFVAVRNGERLDSDGVYQKGGTNGYCQTFAMMLYLGETAGLVKGDFDACNRAAGKFLLSHWDKLWDMGLRHLKRWDSEAPTVRNYNKASLKKFYQGLVEEEPRLHARIMITQFVYKDLA